MALTVGAASVTEVSEELAAVAVLVVLVGTASITEDSDELVVVVAVMEGTASAMTPTGSSSSSVLLLVALVACFAVGDDPDN